MTGFARVNGQNEQCSWLWELKSVNSKGLDIRLRVPTSFDGLELCVREQTAKALTRGNVTISLTVEWAQASDAFQLNQDILDLVISSIPELEARIPNPSPTSAADILALRGVIETFEQEVTDQNEIEIQNQIISKLENEDIEKKLSKFQSGKAQQFRLENLKLKMLLKLQLFTKNFVKKCLELQNIFFS